MMIKHLVRIVKRVDILDINKLKQHPKVVKFIEAPQDYILFEFYDDIYLKRWSPDDSVKYDPKVLDQINKYELEIQELLKPLYSQVSNDRKKYITGYAIVLNDTSYDYITLKRKKYIEHDFFESNLPNTIVFSAYFSVYQPSSRTEFENIIAIWKKWGIENKYIKSITEIKYSAEKYAKIKIDFNSNVADCIIILVLLLNDTRLKTKIDKFGIENG